MHFDVHARPAALTHDPFKALVVPRPIGWIATVDAAGRTNLAPYSFFNAVSDRPPMVMFSSGGHKDSLNNIEASGEFTCSLASWDLRDAMNLSSAPLAPRSGASSISSSSTCAAARSFLPSSNVRGSRAATSTSRRPHS